MRLVKKDIPFPLFPCPSAVAPIIPSIKRGAMISLEKRSNVDGRPIREKGAPGTIRNYIWVSLAPIVSQRSSSRETQCCTFPFFLLSTQCEWRQTLFPVHSNSIASNKSKLPPRGAFKRKEEEGEGSCKCVTSQQIVVKEPHYTLDDTEDPSKHFGHDFLSFPEELLCPERKERKNRNSLRQR